MTQSAMKMNTGTSFGKRDGQKSAQKPDPQTPSDVIANAASQTKEQRQGMFASMKQAFAPYVERHSHTVLYGIVGFVTAALILIVGFWPTVLLALFAAIGVVIGRYRDGDAKTKETVRNLRNRLG